MTDGSPAARRSGRLWAEALAGTVLALVCLGSVPSAGAGPAGRPSPLVQRGHAAFGTCPAATTVMTVRVNGHVFHRGQSVTVHLSATNRATKACSFTGYLPTTAGGRTQELGPCGAAPMVAYNSTRTDVWPGNVYYNCPAESAVTLGAGGTVGAVGHWGLQTSRGFSTVPPGTYTLVVAGRFSFPVVVT